MITKRPWFGPKRIGWGWRPVSWEGWLATVLCVALVVGINVAFTGTATAVYASLTAVVALLVVCILTGTGPG